ncbi:MAG TPA: hypothetical protein PLH57_01125, partial [Oligoflexia bacterium]|nr:hypothetical protein [Oligoflexia bacterium]
LRNKLGINGNLHINRSKTVPVGSLAVNGNGHNIALESRADLLSLRGSRVPIVAVLDGEPGLLDNLGSVIGVPQETLAVRKHSKSGRPVDVYKYHHLDPESIAEAAIGLLERAASEEIIVSSQVIAVANETETTSASSYGTVSYDDGDSETRH